jgi:DNA-directed RNA polymerase subunit RPC12/RpoP
MSASVHEEEERRKPMIIEKRSMSIWKKLTTRWITLVCEACWATFKVSSRDKLIEGYGYSCPFCGADVVRYPEEIE